MHSFPCWMPKPSPPRNECTGCFAPALGNRCRSTLFHNVAARDGAASGRCDQILMPRSHQAFRPVRAVKLLGLCSRIDLGPPLFTLLQLEMPTDGARIARCDRYLVPRSQQTSHPVQAMKLMGTMIRNRCCPPLFTVL